MSLLQGLSASSVETHPFPHLVVENALPDEVYRQLAKEFPSEDTFTKGVESPPNRKFYVRAREFLSSPSCPQGWRRLVEQHLTTEHFAEVVRMFGDHVLRSNPDFETRVGPIRQLRPRVRYLESAGAGDILLDAQLVMHTPVPGPEPVGERETHLKLLGKVVTAFLFLPHEEDDAPGGETELYAIRPGRRIRCGVRNQFEASDLELVRSIPYRSNLMLVLVNTPWSITRITPRRNARFPMRYFDFLVEAPVPVFDVPNVGTPREPRRLWKRLLSFGSRLLPHWRAASA